MTQDAPPPEPDATTGGADDDREQHDGLAGPSPDGTGSGPGPSHELVLPRTGPHPPKRTGVFIDPDDLRNHVGDLLRAYLGGYQVDAWGNFTFTFDGARVFVTVPMTPIGPQVGVFSITNVEVDLTPELATFLLTTNHALGFGSFSFDTDNHAVWLRHTLLGTTLDAPELQATVAAVASTAAHFDDVIRERFGGRAFHDAPEDVQNAARPPEAPDVAGYL
ncbi:MAG TPA: type III secretion system chaperone [Nitriliruptorales bacterium]